MTTILVATVFLASVIGFCLLMKRLRQKGFKARKAPRPAKPRENPEVEVTRIMEALLKLNLLIRRDRHLPSALVHQIEEIIDDLKAVAPVMMAQYPGETLTYEIKQIGSSHLHKTVKEYLDLSGDSREEHFNIFSETMNDLHDVCHRSREIVEKNDTREFKTMAMFLSTKFS